MDRSHSPRPWLRIWLWRHRCHGLDRDGVTPGIGLATHSGGLTAFKGIGGERYADFSRGLPPSSRFSEDISEGLPGKELF